MSSRIASKIARALLGNRRGKFTRDEHGAVAVEFGLLALPFFAIVAAILETAVVFLSGQILDAAVQDVSRLIRTGQVHQMGINSPAKFKERVCDRLYGLFRDCDALHVEVKKQNSDRFADVTITAPLDLANCKVDACDWTRPETFNAGEGSSLIVVQVYYKWPTIIDIGGAHLGNLGDGTRLMSGTTVLRNEPYT